MRVQNVIRYCNIAQDYFQIIQNYEKEKNIVRQTIESNDFSRTSKTKSQGFRNETRTSTPCNHVSLSLARHKWLFENFDARGQGGEEERRGE